VKPSADKGYVHMLQTLVPAGLRGLFLAALFGAIQSTLNSVINSTATVFTIDVYKRLLKPNAPDKHYVRVGVWASIIVMTVAILLAPFINKLGTGLFVYIQTLYAFFAPPFASVFLLGILFRRINTTGATVAVFAGFIFAILLKLWVQFVPDHPKWIEPFAIQAFTTWLFCTVLCVTTSLLTPPPPPEKVSDQLTFNWRKLNITQDLGSPWYRNVVFWWLVFVGLVIALVVIFSGLFL
jgi:solute:Na+ symporter, SSS family